MARLDFWISRNDEPVVQQREQLTQRRDSWWVEQLPKTARETSIIQSIKERLPKNNLSTEILSSLEVLLNNSASHQKEIERILRRYEKNLGNTETLWYLNLLLWDLLELEEKYQREVGKITEDQKNYEMLIMLNKYLKDADWLGTHIKTKLEKAENWSSSKIATEAKEIKITWKVFTKKQ